MIPSLAGVELLDVRELDGSIKLEPPNLDGESWMLLLASDLVKVEQLVV